ncbi:DinB family protein [Cytobacillus sp. Hm23]
MKPETIIERINSFEGFIHFVESLRNMENEKWGLPIAEGKWTVRDIIAHIMLWDKYFLENAIRKIKSQQPLTSRHVNFDDFNNNAVQYGKTKDKDTLISETISYRREIIEHLTSVPRENYEHKYVDEDGNHFTIKSYLDGFIPHDSHHKSQIEQYLNKP